MKEYSIAEKLYYTIKRVSEKLVFEHFVIPFAIGAIVTILFIVFCKIKKQNNILKKSLSIFSITVYFSLIIDITLTSRINNHYEPLSNVFGDWSIFDSNQLMFINSAPAINVVMTIPICFLVFFFIKQFFSKAYSNKVMIGYSAIISFLLSLFIELTQLVTCLGTFQISDLVYNTLGGVIGALIVIFISKKRHLN